MSGLHLHHCEEAPRCKHNLRHAECPRCIEPHIRQIAVALPMLQDLWEVLWKAGIYPEANITDGLCALLAGLVQSNSPPGSEEFAAAEAVLDAGDDAP